MSNEPVNNPQDPECVMSVTLPAYGVNNPRLWFAQVEAIFDCKRIRSEQSKYSYVLAHLPPEVVAEIADVIYERPANDPYTSLKEALISRTAVSDEQNLRTLLSGIDMGDRTPSQLLRHMTQLMGKRALNEPILKELWLQNLPPDMRTVLAVVHKDTALENLAQLADQVHASYGSRATPSIQPVITDLDLKREFESLRRDFAALSLQLNSLTRQISRQRSRSRSKTPARPDKNSNSKAPVYICHYHRKFGSAAKNCKPHCTFYSSFQSQGNETARQ